MLHGAPTTPHAQATPSLTLTAPHPASGPCGTVALQAPQGPPSAWHAGAQTILRFGCCWCVSV
eukprot:4646154-Prymnesium_polylepis.1